MSSIRNNPDKKMSITSMAESVGMSASNFHRKFKQLTGHDLLANGFMELGLKHYS